jgi:hypothetical protein
MDVMRNAAEVTDVDRRCLDFLDEITTNGQRRP